MDQESSTALATDIEHPTAHPSLPQNERYTSLMVLGSGGQGTVYLVQEQNTGTLFALKYSPCTNPDEWKLNRRCYRGEITSLTALKGSVSPHIYDFGTLGGNPYFVMEHLAGPTLHRRLKNKEMPLDEALPLLDELVLRAAAIHEKNIIHRDIKTTNIIIAKRGPVYIDFGISAPLNEETAIETPEQSTSHGIHGTHLSVAPEQFREPTLVRKTLDIYSLGVLAYRLLAGREFRNFPEKSKPFQRIDLILQQGGRIGYEQPRLSSRLLELIETSTAPKPEDRFQTCEEMLAHLRQS